MKLDKDNSVTDWYQEHKRRAQQIYDNEHTPNSDEDIIEPIPKKKSKKKLENKAKRKSKQSFVFDLINIEKKNSKSNNAKGMKNINCEPRFLNMGSENEDDASKDIQTSRKSHIDIEQLDTYKPDFLNQEKFVYDSENDENTDDQGNFLQLGKAYREEHGQSDQETDHLTPVRKAKKKKNSSRKKQNKDIFSTSYILSTNNNLDLQKSGKNKTKQKDLYLETTRDHTVFQEDDDTILLDSRGRPLQPASDSDNEGKYATHITDFKRHRARSPENTERFSTQFDVNRIVGLENRAND